MIFFSRNTTCPYCSAVNTISCSNKKTKANRWFIRQSFYLCSECNHIINIIFPYDKKIEKIRRIVHCVGVSDAYKDKFCTDSKPWY